MAASADLEERVVLDLPCGAQGWFCAGKGAMGHRVREELCVLALGLLLGEDGE